MTDSKSGLTDDQLFAGLVSDLVTQAWIAMGKIKNPVTDTMERNLPLSAMLIDIINMLARKTEGQRSEEETNLINGSLQQLKLNYVSEEAKGEEPEESKETAEEESSPEAQDQESQDNNHE